MRIHLRFFAIVRDRAGLSESVLELAAGSTVEDVKAHLAISYPAIADFMPRIAFAVNQEYVPTTTELHDDDELALIPPVSGG